MAFLLGNRARLVRIARLIPLVVLCAVCGCAPILRWPDAPPVVSAGKTDLQAKPASALANAETQAIAKPDQKTPAEPDALDGLIRRALTENRTVQAAYHNLQSLKHRVMQATTLDDPVASNAIFPIPSVGPQYSLMGYNPYNLTIAQQFPWFGTLKLRGEAAEHDARIAFAELAAAQWDTVAEVKRAYYNLYAGVRAEAILKQTREILEDFQTIAKERLANGGSRQDLIRAEILVSELDRELALNRQGVAGAKAALARQLHARVSDEFPTPARLPLATLPADFDRLLQLAVNAKPEIQGRLAAVARDETAVALAKKRFYPNVTLGMTYMDMEKTNAVTPRTASGVPNIGFFAAFNLPVHRQKYQEGVVEAQERALADAKLHEAEIDEAAGEIYDLLARVEAQSKLVKLLNESVAPKARETFELARSDYTEGNVDYATVQSALRETLQIELQIAQGEAELAKSVASLERAVGMKLTAIPR